MLDTLDSDIPYHHCVLWAHNKPESFHDVGCSSGDNAPSAKHLEQP